MEDQEQKHTCKFREKSFPCGRSLGGHMRSHLINISSSDHDKKQMIKNFPRKKLHPLVKTEFPIEAGGQFGYGLRENPKKTNKSPKSSEEYTLLQEKLCKECGKSFQSWKALFGHMKCHSVIGKLEEDSWDSFNDHKKLISDSQSDSEAETQLCRKKRSNRMKRYKVTTNSSSSLTNIANFSPSVSDNIIDHQEQEEVALSLIILSGDKGNWGGIISPEVESSDNSSDFLEAKKLPKTLKFKKLRNGKLEPTKLNSVKQLELKSVPIPRNMSKTRKSEVSDDEFRMDDKFEKKDLDLGCNESEVDSPRNLIKGQFETDSKKKKNKLKKRNKPTEALVDDEKSPSPFDFEKKSKFKCSMCKKAFPSYQALGGHKSSHKKFNGCCAPRSENCSLLEAKSSHNKSDYSKLIKSEVLFGWKGNNKEHECPICFKVFQSGQALGGHKRSHLVSDHKIKNNASLESDQKPIGQIRIFFDLNLPAPNDEEDQECNDLNLLAFSLW